MLLTPYRTWEQEIDRLLNEVVGRADKAPRAWTPACDAHEDVEGFTVVASLPGVDPKAVSITVDDGVLTIAGERKSSTGQDPRRTALQEIVWGAFRRTFRLPVNVEADRVSASYKDGILTIKLPKKEEAKPRQIAIETK